MYAEKTDNVFLMFFPLRMTVNRRMTDAQKTEAHALLTQGVVAKEVARRVGVSKQALYYWRKKWGLVR